MKLCFTPTAWDDYLWFQEHDRKLLKRINLLLQDMLRSPFEGIGKPEALKADLTGYWSRRSSEGTRSSDRTDLYLLRGLGRPQITLLDRLWCPRSLQRTNHLPPAARVLCQLGCNAVGAQQPYNHSQNKAVWSAAPLHRCRCIPASPGG